MIAYVGIDLQTTFTNQIVQNIQEKYITYEYLIK